MLWQWLVVLTALVSSPLFAQTEGFHYLPIGPNDLVHLSERDKLEMNIETVVVDIGADGYRGSGGRALMFGVGATVRSRMAMNSFVSWRPQVGLFFFGGDPHDASGGRRRRYSLQAPLAGLWSIELYRDERDLRNSERLGLQIGPVFPLMVDITPSGLTTAGNLGIQIGLEGGLPLGDSLLTATLTYARFILGYFHIDDLGVDEVMRIQHSVDTIGVRLGWHHRPSRLGFSASLQRSASLAVGSGRDVLITSLECSFFYD